MTAPRVITRIAAALLLAITSMAGLAVPCASAALRTIDAPVAAPAPHAHGTHEHDKSSAHAHHTGNAAPHPTAPVNLGHDHAGAQACFIHCLSAALPAIATVRDAVVVTADHAVLPLPVLAGLRPMPLERPPNAAV